MSVATKPKRSNPPKPKARKDTPINTEYEDRAKTMLREAMTAAKLDYNDLAERLNAIGVKISGGGAANKISRGGFSASFLLQCLDVLKSEKISEP